VAAVSIATIVAGVPVFWCWNAMRSPART
jgi:hypothetical protein